MPHRPINRDPTLTAATIPLDLLKRLVGAAAGIAPDREAVELARAEITSIEALVEALADQIAMEF